MNKLVNNSMIALQQAKKKYTMSVVLYLIMSVLLAIWSTYMATVVYAGRSQKRYVLNTFYLTIALIFLSICLYFEWKHIQLLREIKKKIKTEAQIVERNIESRRHSAIVMDPEPTLLVPSLNKKLSSPLYRSRELLSAPNQPSRVYLEKQINDISLNQLKLADSNTTIAENEFSRVFDHINHKDRNFSQSELKPTNFDRN